MNEEIEYTLNKLLLNASLYSIEYSGILSFKFSISNKSIYYDSERNQFAFDYGTYIKYLIIPDSFPHDALEYRYTDKFENESFWNKIQ